MFCLLCPLLSLRAFCENVGSPSHVVVGNSQNTTKLETTTRQMPKSVLWPLGIIL